MHYYIGLGSNIGEREQTIESALCLLEQEVGTIVRRSDYYYSAPWGFESEHGFCNLCVRIDSELQPLEVLARTQQIELTLGRTEKSGRDEEGKPVYHDRPIDIDLIRGFEDPSQPPLFRGGESIDREVNLKTEKLTLPHPHWQERDFVRIPLSQILA